VYQRKKKRRYERRIETCGSLMETTEELRKNHPNIDSKNVTSKPPSVQVGRKSDKGWNNDGFVLKGTNKDSTNISRTVAKKTPTARVRDMRRKK